MVGSRCHAGICRLLATVTQTQPAGTLCLGHACRHVQKTCDTLWLPCRQPASMHNAPWYSPAMHPYGHDTPLAQPPSSIISQRSPWERSEACRIRCVCSSFTASLYSGGAMLCSSSNAVMCSMSRATGMAPHVLTIARTRRHRTLASTGVLARHRYSVSWVFVTAVVAWAYRSVRSG